MVIEVRISYDYEAFWGVWDKTSPSYITSNVRQAHGALRGILALHVKHHIPCCVALVGALLDRDHSGDDIMQASNRPAPEKAAFRAAAAPYTGQKDLFHTPLDVLEQLRNRADLFEIGSHTHSHVYALEASKDVLIDDFARFETLFQDTFGRPPKSLVMPKNQVTQAALNLAQDFGFDSIRVNPDTPLYRAKSWPDTPVGRGMARLIRLLRFGDAFLPLVELAASRRFHQQNVNGMQHHVGQFFVRPFFAKPGAFSMHLWRLKLGLWLGRLRGHPVHYWSHPHNFGRNTQQALHNYDRFLGWLKQQEDNGSITLMHMSPAAPASCVGRPAASTEYRPG